MPNAARRNMLPLLVLTVTATRVGAQQQVGDLADMSIEQLMNMPVTSVSKTEQKLSRTPAAVFVITRDDIRRSHATNIPDLLRIVPGVDVAQINAHTWAVGVRGLNGRFSNLLLVMVDGRTVYSQQTSGVFWDAVDVPLETIERIEVIRGPGGAIWGANAANGVVNIITREAGATHGAALVAGAGTADQRFTTLQFADRVAEGSDYRVFVKYTNTGEQPGETGPHGEDAWHALRGGFRLDSIVSASDTVAVEADAYRAREDSNQPVLVSITSPGPVAVPAVLQLTGGSIQAAWDHKFSDRSDTHLKVYYDQYRREESPAGGVRTVDADFQHHLNLQWQELVWGLGYRDFDSVTAGSLFVSLNPATLHGRLINTFIQDQVTLLGDWVHLTLGTKFEHNDLTGLNAMPSARLAWEPSTGQTFWLAASRAVHPPDHIHTSIRLNLAGVHGPGGVPALVSEFGNPGLQDEDVLAYEFGYRAEIHKRLSVDIAAYYNHYTNLQTIERSAPFFETTPAPAHLVFASTFENLMHGAAQGMEVFANWNATDRWTLAAGYAFEKVHLHLDPNGHDTASLGNAQGSSPANSAQLRSHLSLREHLTWGVSVYSIGPVAQPPVPAYVRVDTGLTWQGDERFSLSVVGQNLLDDHHLEYVDSTQSVNSTLVKRAAYVKGSWKF